MRHDRARFIRSIAIAIASAIAFACRSGAGRRRRASRSRSRRSSSSSTPAPVTPRPRPSPSATAEPIRNASSRCTWTGGSPPTAPSGSKQPGTEGKASIADYLRTRTGRHRLAPGETRELTLTLDLPASFPKATAVYHSGFFVRAVPPTGHVNFGPAATVVAYDTVGTPTSHAKITQLHVGAPGNGSAATVGTHRQRRQPPTLARAAASSCAASGQVVVDETDNIPVLFADEARVFNKTLSGLAPGSYDVSFTLDYGGPDAHRRNDRGSKSGEISPRCVSLRALSRSPCRFGRCAVSERGRDRHGDNARLQRRQHVEQRARPARRSRRRHDHVHHHRRAVPAARSPSPRST